MTTAKIASKTGKPKTNNYVSILDQLLEKYNFSADFTPEQLSEYASEFDALLLDWMTRRCVKVALARRSFSKERIKALVPDLRKSNDKLTIEKRAKYYAKDGDVMDIFTHHLDLGPKNSNENEIVAGTSRQSQFRVKLTEAGADPKVINTYAKDKELIQESNKIQKKGTKKGMANSDRILMHCSLARVSKRLQNINTSKTPTREDLADVIIMLSMRPAEVRSLQINHYELNLSKISAWYEEGYSWYCTGYLKSRGENKKNPVPGPFLSMEKNPERAKELLIWIQDAIKSKKLRDPVFTKSGKGNDTPFNEFLKQKPYKSLPEKLRKYGCKHASRIHGDKNSASEQLKRLLRIALRQESNHLDAGDNYTRGDTESEDSGPESNHESDHESESVLKANGLKPQPDSQKSQTIEMDFMLAKIDAMLAIFSHKFEKR